MDDRKHSEYRQTFLRLQQTYVRRLHNTVRIINNIFELEKLSPLLPEDLVRIQSLAHGLAGSGATFGYPEISTVGAEADEFLTHMLRREDYSESSYAHLRLLLKNIQKTCETSALNADITATPLDQRIPSTSNIDRNVLIVDDDGDVAAAIAHGLEPTGMTVKICTSGEEALYYLPRKCPDIVILDVALTGINGLEVLKHIKQSPEFIDIPVVIICTRHNDEVETMAMKAGAQAFIAKPLDIEFFTRQIQKICEETRINSPAFS